MGSSADETLGEIPIRNQKLFEVRGLIAGSWRHARDGRTFAVFEPSSGEVLRRCSDLGRQDFIDAIDSANLGYRQFSESTTAKERGTLLRNWHQLLMENMEDLAIILSLENGKTLAEARGELTLAASYVSWFAEEAPRSYGDVIPSSFRNATVMTMREPVGVCGMITPWNFPAAMITRKIAPAIAAGCAVVVKPPPETPFSALALAKLAVEAGIPPDVIHVVPTSSHEASAELLTSPKVAKISFTGSTRVGKELTRMAASTMKKVSMELGGNAPFIVFEDANLDLAVEGAMACKFRCSGQTCVCANRFYVHDSIVEEFAMRLADRVRGLKLGRGIDPGTTNGPLVSEAAVRKVDGHVRDALSKGAVLLTGGKALDRKGYFYEPTVLMGATREMDVAVEETFGPVASIFSFQTEHQAIQLANDTDLGLAGYFFTRQLGRAMRVARALECGMVGVNTGFMTAVESPFGGIKASGVGLEGSKYGICEYQNVKSVTFGNLDD